MNDESDENRITLMTLNEFVLVGFFSEVEMRCDRMLEKMND